MENDPIANLKQNAENLESWMKSVADQITENQWHTYYSVEAKAKDALDIGFRISASVVQALKDIVEILEKKNEIPS